MPMLLAQTYFRPGNLDFLFPGLGTLRKTVWSSMKDEAQVLPMLCDAAWALPTNLSLLTDMPTHLMLY